MGESGLEKGIQDTRTPGHQDAFLRKEIKKEADTGEL